MRIPNRVLSLAVGLFVVVSTTVVDAQTQSSVAFPDAETLATDGAAIQDVLAEAGLDAAWRSSLELHPAARLMSVDYRDGGEADVAALLRTTLELATVTTERDDTVSELRRTAIRLDDAFEEERTREIERNRADAYYQGIDALTQAVAIDVFAGEDPSTSAILGLDGEALTVAQREFELTHTTLDEMFALRAQAREDLDDAIAALDAAIETRRDIEARHASFVDRAAELNSRRRSLDASARAVLPAAADAYSVAAIPGQPGMTPKALGAYLHAEETLATVSPACHVSWRTIAAIASVEGLHGEYGGRRLSPDGRPGSPIVGIALNGQTVDNYGNTTAALVDTDGGRYDGDASFDRAVGPLQFIPQTWATWKRDGDGDGEMDPQDIDDAALAAGAYLCNYGSLRYWDGWSRAVFGYNHSGAYVNSVKASLDRVLRLRLPDFEGDEALRQRSPYGAWVPMPVEPPPEDPAAPPEDPAPPADTPAAPGTDPVPTATPTTAAPATTAPPTTAAPATTAPPATTAAPG